MSREQESLVVAEHETEDILPTMKRALIRRFRLTDNETTPVRGCIAPVGGRLFATDGVKQYLVLGQSADELRDIIACFFFEPALHVAQRETLDQSRFHNHCST